MTQVLTRRHSDPDFRLIYLREAECKRRIHEVYEAHCEPAGAPFIDTIVDDLWDVIVTLFVDNGGNNGMFDARVHVVQQTGDPILGAEIILSEPGGRAFLDLFYRDVYLYLLDQQLFCYERSRGVRSREEARVYNSVIVEVW